MPPKRASTKKTVVKTENVSVLDHFGVSISEQNEQPEQEPAPQPEPVIVEKKKRATKKTTSVPIPEPSVEVKEEVHQEEPVEVPTTKKAPVKKRTTTKKTTTSTKKNGVTKIDEIDSIETVPTMKTVADSNENVILQLSIDPAIFQNQSENYFENKFFDYEPSIQEPDAFDDFQNSDFISKPLEIKNADQTTTTKRREKSSTSANSTNNQSSRQTVYDHLSEFLARDDWPISTNISCFWCCNPFHNQPFGIPIKYAGGKFHVFGCFCSLECAAAYNFYSHEVKHDVWESYNLINMLSRKIGYKDYVTVAPSQHTLKMFGGYMEIDEFRAFCQSNKLVNTHSYPMVAMVQQLEEINDNDNFSARKNAYIPIDKQKLITLENKVRLERTKPLHTSKNTLDHTMKLKSLE